MKRSASEPDLSMNNRCRGDNWKAEINCILPAFLQCTEGLFHTSWIDSVIHWRTDWLTDPNNEINVVVLLLTGRPTEIPEKDIYLNEARYDEEEGQFRKLKGLKVLWSLTEIYSWINYSWTNEWIGCSVENVWFYQKGGSRSKIVLVKQANKVVRLIQNWLS